MNWPSSTYRVQLNSKFTLNQLRGIIPYLHHLGVSAIYASPITKAVSGSMHGYDVTDPDEINPEIGTLEELREIAGQLAALNMTWLQDIVPNHMAFSCDNKRLMDVLERGERSPYYMYFDISWDHTEKAKRGKVMLPVLGNEQTLCIQDKELTLQWTPEGPAIVYFDQQFPVAPGIYEYLLPVNHPIWRTHVDSLYGLWTAPLKEWTSHKQQLLDAVNADADVMQYLQQRIREINNSHKELVKWLSCQHYILDHWKQADTAMNYRRFFAVNSLISLKAEDPRVFSDYHRFIHSLYKEKLIQGVRIDHIDGLCNPRAYVHELRKLLGDDCYIIAEKILEYHEEIPQNWELQGTSGYEFLAFTNQLLTDAEGGEAIREFYQGWIENPLPYEDMVFEKKFSFLNASLGGEWERLVTELESLQLLQGVAYSRDRLKKALGIWMAAFPVYRIYPSAFPVEEREMQVVRRAFAIAGVKAPDCIEELEALQTVFESNGDPARDARKMKFIMRLMQFTGPLAAKGVEDTTFYVYNPLISHNEVGDAPAQLGVDVEDFHRKMQARQLANPLSLNTTSTHDTKRGEDARMRINVLADLSTEWISIVQQWHRINTSVCAEAGLQLTPSRNDEYFIYQSLIGSYPLQEGISDSFLERSKDFIIKALREAKVHTTYTEANSDYENACVVFMQGILRNDMFMRSFLPFLQKIAPIAAIYSLVQVVVKCTAPGIPDFYQGSELWDTSYVDPDNRRDVDYAWRASLLHSLIEKEQPNTSELMKWMELNRLDGVEKLFAVSRLLPFRKKNPELFAEGAYLPLKTVNGDRKVVAYARQYRNKWAITIVPVGIARAEQQKLIHPVWDKVAVELPEEAPAIWRDIFTGREIRRENGLLLLHQVFASFPVAVLEA